VEGVASVAVVRRRIGERPDHLQELHDRSWPAVGQHQRKRVGVRGAGVEEVDPEPVDLDPELRERVQARLGCAPVVLVCPVGAQLLQVAERDALRPVLDWLAFRPAGAPEAVAQVVELGVGNLDAERRDRIGHRASLNRGTRRRPHAGPRMLSHRPVRSLVSHQRYGWLRQKEDGGICRTILGRGFA
jgi:hypothetical protein